jgi:hypothetical protein
MGNGSVNTIKDIVYVRPDIFEAKYTRDIANELEQINRQLADESCAYLLIGFGRWGSSDPWLGIPVNWAQVSAAKVIIEATRPDMNVDLSQGSHFFHNLSSFQVSYFSVHHDSEFGIQWDWLDEQKRIAETRFVRHVRLPTPLLVKVDGRSGRGVIFYD